MFSKVFTSILLSAAFSSFLSIAAFAAAADPETLVFSFQKQKNPEDLKSTTEVVSKYLAKKLGKKIEVIVPTSYGATVQALINNKVHIAYMDSLPFILASAETKLEILAVENRNGKTNYDSLIVVGKDSPFKNLKDLKGHKIAFSSQTSTSGFLFPFYKLSQSEGLATIEDLNGYFSQIIYAGGYDKSLLAVANGQTDAAAFSDYAFEGKKADLYGSEEVRKKVKVLTRISGVPTHLIAGTKSLSSELLKKIQKALLEMDKEQPELLSSVYGAASLVKPKGNHVEGTQSALRATGLEPKSFVK